MGSTNRKNVRLKGYDYPQSNAYFVTICTHDRAELFGEIVGAALCGRPNAPDKMIAKWLLELENKYQYAKVDKYVIMPDHIHFIISGTGDHTGSPLPSIIAWFKTMTTNEYIRGVKDGLFMPFKKRLWQRGYYEHIVRNQTDYNEIWAYIDGNPSAKQETPTE